MLPVPGRVAIVKLWIECAAGRILCLRSDRQFGAEQSHQGASVELVVSTEWTIPSGHIARTDRPSAQAGEIERFILSHQP